MRRMRRTPHAAPPKWGIKELRKRRAAHALASAEERVRKAEEALARVEASIEVLRDQVRAVQSQGSGPEYVGPVRQQQPSYARAYSSRRHELQREAERARQRLETERGILRDLRRRLATDAKIDLS